MICPAIVPNIRIRYGTKERPGPGVRFPRRMYSSHITDMIMVETAPATGVPNSRLASIVKPQRMSPDAMAMPAQPIFWLRDSVVVV